MKHVIRKFAASAKRLGVRPVVVFIPRNYRDRESPNALISALRSGDESLEIHNMGEADINWSEFNFKGYVCHPSRYGYRAIAEYVAAILN